MHQKFKTFSASSKDKSLSLSFIAQLESMEGILTVIQEWSSEHGIRREDGLSLRLVLDELLANICMHPRQSAKTNLIELHLEILSSHTPTVSKNAVQKLIRITLRDTAPPFNPLTHEAPPVSDISNTQLGGRGLTLIRLLTMHADYQWTGSGNRLCLDLPLDGTNKPKTKTQSASSMRPTAHTNMKDFLFTLWAGNLAFRQTTLFTLCAVVLIWGSMALYLAEITRERSESAHILVTQAMHTQSVISSTFLDRVASELQVLAQGIQNHPDTKNLIATPDALLWHIQQRSGFRSLIAEIPVVGITIGYHERVLLYRIHNGDITSQTLPREVSDLVAPASTPSRWESLFMKFQEKDPHATMLYAVPIANSGDPYDGWIGTIISMPWIANTLKSLSGFNHVVPFYLNSTGHYIIYPIGRQLGSGPQSLSDEARIFKMPGLHEMEQQILAGEKGVSQLHTVLPGNEAPWPVSWDGPTSIAYYPMRTPGWYLGMLVSSEEIGDIPEPIPTIFFLMAILGPLAIACITWFVTSRTLRPLHELVAALDRLGKGDIDIPVPRPRFHDEIGVMLTTFERVRVTVRASFRNLVNTAAIQQRIQNELALARNIQESMLPAVFPTIPWAAVHADIEMSREVCGDLYDCFTPDTEEPSRLCCVIGDVCGKGIPAAIIMSRAISLARAFQLEGLSPAETLARLNKALLRSDNSSMFVTMLVGVLEPSGTFTWASAGHPPPLLGPTPSHSHDHGFDPQPTTMPPWPGELVLGVRSEQRYSTFTTYLAPGQSLLLYTDGADEAQGPPVAGRTLNELYGEARLVQSFDQACRTVDTSLPSADRPAAIVNRIRADIMDFMGDRQPVDDISFLIVTRDTTPIQDQSTKDVS